MLHSTRMAYRLMLLRTLMPRFKPRPTLVVKMTVQMITMMTSTPNVRVKPNSSQTASESIGVAETSVVPVAPTTPKMNRISMSLPSGPSISPPPRRPEQEVESRMAGFLRL